MHPGTQVTLDLAMCHHNKQRKAALLKGNKETEVSDPVSERERGSHVHKDEERSAFQGGGRMPHVTPSGPPPRALRSPQHCRIAEKTSGNSGRHSARSHGLSCRPPRSDSLINW